MTGVCVDYSCTCNVRSYIWLKGENKMSGVYICTCVSAWIVFFLIGAFTIRFDTDLRFVPIKNKWYEMPLDVLTALIIILLLAIIIVLVFCAIARLAWLFRHVFVIASR
jgi:hypothetical protein